jgi:hypothetical protein
MMNWKDFLNFSMLSINHITKLILLLVLFCTPAFSQQDTVTSGKETDTSFVMSKSPWGAVLRSAVIPGLGQIYNESYLKAVVVWGAGAWLVYNWVDNNNLYRDYQNIYNSTPEDSRLKPIYRNYREFYRDNRDLFTIYLGIAYVLQLVDAYVDAHLFDFTVEEDFYTGAPLLNIRIKLF